ncbi:MAG: stage II sporulation protein R [Clostridia bacterium]|nr:stage II sporulation protein R [Clostridia bacterium]
MKKIFNFLKNSKIKMIFILSFLLFIYISICALSYASNITTDISNSVFRLHVIANSNSKEDQDLKYKVRDSLIKYMNDICSNCKTKQEAIELVTKYQNNFKQISLDTIQNEGYNYDVNINIGNFEFPTKQYGDISFPAGYYDALKVEIGEAKGHNWWCVMFPPLCFVDITSGIIPEESKENLQNNMTEEEYALISDDSSPDIKFKFKILEFFNQNGLITAKK